MGIVRNSIEIVGITPEDELPYSKGQVIEYCESENISIPDDNASIGQILKIEVGVEIKSNRVINAPSGNIVVLDGVKKLKIVYSERHKDDRATILRMKLPYNTFIELKNARINLSRLKINIADACFSLLDSRRIYSHILYIIDIPYIYDPDEGGKDLKSMIALKETRGDEKFQHSEGKIEAYDIEENVEIEAITNLNELDEVDDIQNIIPQMSRVDWNSII